MYLLYDKDYIIRVISSKKASSENLFSVKVKNDRAWSKLIYKKLPKDTIEKLNIKTKKPNNELRVAIICNWKDKCGISTYSQYLVNSLASKVKEIAIFSEIVEENINIKEENVFPCWERGEDLSILIESLKKYNPDFIIIQHEYGIFPNAFRFMQLMQHIDNIPYVVVMHSVYKHLDKAVYSESAKNIIVHSEEGKKVLKEMGNTNNIFVIPHGCVQLKNTSELWNICINPYTITQFGFGFAYKGVDRALRAVAHLKSTQKKYENMQYIYLCSTNSHNNGTNSEYCNKLISLAKELNISSNIVIIQKYQTEEMINLYLRLTKIAIFPYVIDSTNEVFGASGAIRIALSNKRPVIASESHLFDDLTNVVPRPASHIELANEIDKIFSSSEYRNKLVNDGSKYVNDNSWDLAANKYLQIYNDIMNQE